MSLLHQSAMNEIGEPYVEIVIHPKTHGQRFRYKCESRSAGCLIGDGSTNENKVYPTIEIKNLNGQAAIIVVSCVSKDPPHYPHPHNLVGSDCKDGVCTIRIKPPRNVATISGIGIQCCKRQEVQQSLAKRSEIRVDPFSTGPDPNTKIDLSVVRLCFQVFLPDASKRFTKVLTPVVSNPIIDKKTVHDLIITRLSSSSGKMTGGDDMIILCEKVRKDDIQVRFFEQSDDGELLWENYADLSTIDVHHQYAISFKTPPYRDVSSYEAVDVFIQLHRPSTFDFGDPKPFVYKPVDQDPDGFKTKRKKANAQNFASFYSGQLLPSTLEAFPEEDETNSAASNARHPRRARRGAGRGSFGRPSVPVASSQNQAPTPSASILPMYTYDSIGPPQSWNVVAPSGSTTGRFIQDEMSQIMFSNAGQVDMTYTFDPASYSVYQGHMTDATSAVTTDDTTAYQPLSMNEAMLSQLAEYMPGGQELMTSTELLQQLNASHLTEVPANEFGLIFNSHDAANAVDQLLNEPSVNPPNT